MSQGMRARRGRGGHSPGGGVLAGAPAEMKEAGARTRDQRPASKMAQGAFRTTRRQRDHAGEDGSIVVGRSRQGQLRD